MCLPGPLLFLLLLYLLPRQVGSMWHCHGVYVGKYLPRWEECVCFRSRSRSRFRYRELQLVIVGPVLSFSHSSHTRASGVVSRFRSAARSRNDNSYRLAVYAEAMTDKDPLPV